jgi:sulfatase maturation enzyme AslB (radical SAM superfamily)
MIDGTEPKDCAGCFNMERKYGIPQASKRWRESTTWIKFADRTKSSIAEFKIPYIDLRYSNICNFKCRSCGPAASHSIAAEQHVKPHVLRFKLDSVTDMLDNNIEFLEEIYFIGGEPLLMDEPYILLDKLIDAGNTAVNIRYNSNISKLTFKHINVVDKWKHFSNVNVNASIDHYGSKLEYIRHGAIWSETYNNLELLKSLPNVTLKIHCLLSVFNILDITDIITKYFDLGLVDSDHFVPSLLDYPQYYSIKALHPDLKLIAQERIRIFLKNNEHVHGMLRMTLEHVANTILDENYWYEQKQKFEQVTTNLDALRGENFLNTFPDLGKQIHE